MQRRTLRRIQNGRRSRFDARCRDPEVLRIEPLKIEMRRNVPVDLEVMLLFAERNVAHQAGSTPDQDHRTRVNHRIGEPRVGVVASGELTESFARPPVIDSG